MIEQIRMSVPLLVQKYERVKVRLREGTFLEGCYCRCSGWTVGRAIGHRAYAAGQQDFEERFERMYKEELSGV
jgi:hypothetical protein